MGNFFSSSFLPGDLPSIAIVTCCVLTSATLVCNLHKIPPLIYDKLILQMTEVWYRTVLDEVKEGSSILDIGIGTAGALLRCKEMLLSKNISVTGIDYNEIYVKAAQESIEQNNLTSSIEVEYKSVYDIPAHPPIILTLPSDKSKKRYFDAAYFSGSISLLPSSVEALRAVAEVVKPGGLIYVTQTYQRKSLPLLKYIKPLLKFVTSIDFGQLVMIDDVEDLWSGSGLDVIKHEVIPGSIDNRYQAAYLTILKVPNRIVSQ